MRAKIVRVDLNILGEPLELSRREKKDKYFQDTEVNVYNM